MRRYGPHVERPLMVTVLRRRTKNGPLEDTVVPAAWELERQREQLNNRASRPMRGGAGDREATGLPSGIGLRAVPRP